MKRFYLILIICLFPLLASGQALKGSYFSENSAMRNKMNPAFAPRSSYFGFAALDNIGFGMTGNVGVSNFLFPSGSGDGSLLTFLHPDVSSETFLKKLPANPHIDLDFDTDILNIGFFTGKNSFWSIGLGVKVDGEANLPKELFTFLKNGAANDPQEYNIRNLSVIANAYAELSLGYSHDMSDIVKGLSVGARVKFLAGIGRLDARINNMNLRMASDQWRVQADAAGYLMFNALDVYRNSDGFGTEFDTSRIGLAGMGAAFDFGAEYRLHINDFFDSIRFSAAVTDLGFLNFPARSVQKFQTSGDVVYTGVDNIEIGENMNLDDTFNEITDQFKGFLDNLEEVPGEKVNSRIKPQVYVGVEMPFLWNKMSLGLLYNAKFGYTSTRNELTLALNARPGKAFNIGVNYSMLNTAKSIGWLIEFTPRSGIGFFLGTDYMMLEYANVQVTEGLSLPVLPVNQLNINMRFGFHLALGNPYDEVAMAKKAARAERRAKR